MVTVVTKQKDTSPAYFIDGQQSPEIGPAFTHYSQSLRASRTMLHLWIAVVLSISYVLFLSATPSHAVAVWILFILAAGALREKICSRVRNNLHAEIHDFETNEFSLQLSSYLVSVVVGAGFWIVAWSGDNSLIMAVLLASILYAIGSTTILSSHLHSCAVSLAVNYSRESSFLLLLNHRGRLYLL